ncbi:hypothetical protein [Moellerella wisconsensis]|uniref:Uncharacterized protein n=1 Tax=Moellerella wisconsensis TaxID=158849 RepID=A0A9Q8Q1N5_9GAMM|nr:hypothetical protein [Moellerella wisconsensis]UNH30840.1 hypothetical protein MNY72_00475 [Moellerella wisconsensis]
MMFSNLLNKLKDHSKTLLILFAVFGVITLYKGCSSEEKTYYRVGEVKGVQSCGQLGTNSYLCGVDIYDTSIQQLLDDETVRLKSKPYVGNILMSQCILKGSKATCSDEWIHMR